MSVDTITLASESQELFTFLPAISASYLFILGGDQRLLFSAAVLTALATFLVLNDYRDTEIIIGQIYYQVAIFFAGLVITLGLIIAMPLLLIHYRHTPDKITTIEVATTGLFLLHVVVITGGVFDWCLLKVKDREGDLEYE